MILKPIDQITEADLMNLVSSGVSERRTIDYKEQLPELNDAGKRELLADVSSFANTAGGDLIFGVSESAAVPTGVPGVEIGNVDQTILRFDNIIRDGLSPRIRHRTEAVSLINGRYVLIVRADHSWYGPHRVIFKGDSRFYGRTSKGKYELDVTDLRNAFLFANTVAEKSAAFRVERVISLENGRSVIPLAKGPKLAIHCIPLDSFAATRQHNVLILNTIQSRPLNHEGPYRQSINFEGTICFELSTPSVAYTQIYRNGVIEAVHAGVFNNPQKPHFISAVIYERTLVDYLPHCFEIVAKLGSSAPVLVGISLIGVRGMRLEVGMRTQLLTGGGNPIDRDVLMLPEILVEDLSTRIGPLLKPMLDLVWNACGFSSSPSFDDAGKWTGTTYL